MCCASTIFVHRFIITVSAFAAALAATPAAAQASTSVPEPGDMAAMFALGVIGLIIGRQGARRRKD